MADEDRRTLILEFRASPRERDLIDDLAAASGTDRSGYIRLTVLGRRPAPVLVPPAFEMAGALATIGKALDRACRAQPPAVDPKLVAELRKTLAAVAGAIFAA